MDLLLQLGDFTKLLLSQPVYNMQFVLFEYTGSCSALCNSCLSCTQAPNANIARSLLGQRLYSGPSVCMSLISRLLMYVQISAYLRLPASRADYILRAADTCLLRLRSARGGVAGGVSRVAGHREHLMIRRSASRLGASLPRYYPLRIPVRRTIRAVEIKP